MSNAFRETSSVVFRDLVTFVTGFNVIADQPFNIGSPTSTNSFLQTYNELRPFGGVSGVVSLTGEQSIYGFKHFGDVAFFNAPIVSFAGINIDNSTSWDIVSNGGIVRIGDITDTNNGSSFNIDGGNSTFTFENNGYNQGIDVLVGGGSCPTPRLGFYDLANDSYQYITVGDQILSVADDFSIGASLSVGQSILFGTFLQSSSPNITLLTQGNKKAEITSGNFGINIPVGKIPQYTLDVSGTGNFQEIQISGQKLSNIYYSQNNPSGYLTGFNSGLYALNTNTGFFVTTGQTGYFASQEKIFFGDWSNVLDPQSSSLQSIQSPIYVYYSRIPTSSLNLWSIPTNMINGYITLDYSCRLLATGYTSGLWNMAISLYSSGNTRTSYGQNNLQLITPSGATGIYEITGRFSNFVNSGIKFADFSIYTQTLTGFLVNIELKFNK